jgi:hypothetical protein
MGSASLQINIFFLLKYHDMSVTGVLELVKFNSSVQATLARVREGYQ